MNTDEKLKCDVVEKELMQIENEIDTNCNGDRILAAIRPAPTEHTEGPKINFMSQILKHNSKKNFYMYI